MERFGSDKPDLRFAMELVDLAPALTGADGAPASGFRVFDETLASGGRVKAIAAPGMGGVTRARDRRADRAREAVRRQGPRPPRGRSRAASSTGRSRSSCSPRRRRAIRRRATGATEGDLVLVVADTARGRRTTSSAGCASSSAGGSGLADPDELAYCWVHRFPMYKWDAEEHGRWDATHNPFSGVVPEDEVLLTTTSGEPRRPVPGRPRRPGPGDAVRRRAQRLGAGRRLGADLGPRTCSPAASTCRATRWSR